MFEKMRLSHSGNKGVYQTVRDESTILERKQMLVNHRKEIEKKIASLNDTLAFIDYKTNLYDEFLSKKLDYYSYFTKKDTK